MIEPPRTPIEVVIESPRFSHIKRRADGHIDFVSPLPCPFNYGCVPNLISGDGDPIDAVVLGRRLPRGTRTAVRVLAVVDFVDAGETDPKWICSTSTFGAVDQATVHGFFTLYALAKGLINRLRGKHGPTAYRGLRVVG